MLLFSGIKELTININPNYCAKLAGKLIKLHGKVKVWKDIG